MYRILIADDEPIERMVLAKTIQTHFADQLEVIQAVNGREAIELFSKEKVNIVILDIEMPGINGLEAATQIRQLDKCCSIIFLTAFDHFTYAKKAIAVKALDYLLKPTNEDELIAVLEEAIFLAKEQADSTKPMAPKPAKQLVSDTEKMEQIRMQSVQEVILNYIHKHYVEDISLQDVAYHMNYSDAYFCKLFKQCFGKSFTTYLTEYRVEKSIALLADVTVNVKEISEQVGYRDSNYFAKVFKRVNGVTPSEYRALSLEKSIQ